MEVRKHDGIERGASERECARRTYMVAGSEKLSGYADGVNRFHDDVCSCSSTFSVSLSLSLPLLLFVFLFSPSLSSFSYLALLSFLSQIAPFDPTSP